MFLGLLCVSLMQVSAPVLLSPVSASLSMRHFHHITVTGNPVKGKGTGQPITRQDKTATANHAAGGIQPSTGSGIVLLGGTGSGGSPLRKSDALFGLRLRASCVTVQ
uniref:Secreted protein n=1 Tax=Anguilla anguilla TaxID=7936 RepID=A0A0E9WY60_ANGAN